MDHCLKSDVSIILEFDYQKTIKEASTVELYHAISKATMKYLGRNWGINLQGKQVCYLSIEFLVGRFIYSNLYNMGLLDQFKEMMKEYSMLFSLPLAVAVWSAPSLLLLFFSSLLLSSS